MPTNYGYPDNITLTEVAQELMPRLTAQRPIFDDFPIRNVDTDILEWEQRDNFQGLQQIRGLGGAPNRVTRIGAKRYRFEPGYYGEYVEINERELTRRRRLGMLTGRVDVTDLVALEQARLLQRRIDRIETVIWSLLSTGTFSVAQGTLVMATDQFAIQTYSAATPWATSNTAAPLADLRAMPIKARGYSLSFGPGSKAYMNQSTATALLSNTNTGDFGGRRIGLQTVNSIAQVNELNTLDGLPNIVVYDQTYYDDTGTLQLFIPNNKVIVVGRRTSGDTLGEYQCTINMQNGDGESGPYMFVYDSAIHDGGKPPRHLEVHDGHNGGPVLFHPAGVVVMTV